MPPSRLSFCRHERLKSEKHIAELFARQQSVGEYPFRLFWMEVQTPLPAPMQMAFSVPKKKFKRAVDRNAIRRRMREAYRLQKATIYKALEGHPQRYLVGMIVYTAPQPLTLWEAWTTKMERLFQKLLRQLPPPLPPTP